MKKNNVYAIILLVATFAQIVGCRESAEVKIVKQTYVEVCASKTIDQMVTGSFVSPAWVGGKTESGSRFVSVNGQIRYLGKKVNGLVKFIFDKTGDGFQFEGFEINEIPQDRLVFFGLIDEMCEGAHRSAEAVKKNLQHIARTSIALNAETGTWQRASLSDYFGAFGRQSPVEEESPFGARYSYWIAVNGTPTIVPGQRFEHGSCDLLTPPTSVQVSATDEGFIAAAKGNLDDDATCDEWSVNDQKEVKHVVNDTIN